MNGNQTTNSFGISTSTILKIFGVLLGLYFFYLIRDVVLLLVISMIISSALIPLVEWLYSRVKFPRGLTVVLVYVLFIGVVVLISSILFPRLLDEFQTLGSSISSIREKIQNGDSAISGLFNQFGLEQALQSISSSLTTISSQLVERTIGVFSGLFSMITVLVISFYLVIEQDALKDFVKSLTPPVHHPRINSIVQKAQHRLGRWLLGMLGLMFSIFLMTYIGLSILGVKNALALALFAGLLEVIPYLGPIISAIPAAFVAFIHSPLVGLIVILLYIGIQQFENYVLVPRVLGKSIGANPLVIMIALLVGFRLAGVVGMLIAAPLVAVATVVMEDYQGFKKTS